MGRLMVKSETAAQHLREVKRKENDVYTFIAFCSFFFFLFPLIPSFSALLWLWRVGLC
jgi:hypothetical protein